MPWQPPERSPLVPLLLNNLLQQRSQEQSDAARAEARQKAINEQREYALASETAKYGGSKALMETAALYPSIATEKLHALGTIGDLALKKQREEKKAAEALDPVQLQALGQTAASRPDASGRLVPPPQLAQDAAQAALRERAAALSDPRDVTSLATQFAQFKGQAEAAAQEGISTERRSDARSRSLSIDAERRAETTAAADATASFIGATAFGLGPAIPGLDLGNAETSIPIIAEELRKGGVDPGRAKEVFAKAREVWTSLYKWEKDAQGKGVDVKNVEARARQLQRDYPGVVPNQELLDNLLLESQGRSLEDPVMRGSDKPAFISTPDTKSRQKIYAQREDLVDLGNKSQSMRQAYASVVEDQRNGKMAGGPGSLEGMYDLASFAGEDVASVQAYRAQVFTFASSLLKSVQGGRFSDKDLAMQLLTFPTLSEIGTPNGDRKLAAMEANIEAQKIAPYSKAARARLAANNNVQLPAMSTKMRMLLSDIRTGKVDPNDPSVQSEFLKEADAFAQRPGSAEALGKIDAGTGRVTPDQSEFINNLLRAK